MIYEKMSVWHLGQVLGAPGEAIGIVSWKATHFRDAGDGDRALALEQCQSLLSHLVRGLPEGLVYLDGALPMTRKEEEDRNTLRKNTEAIIAAAKER